MPADKLVVLGVISSKVGELESPEAMEAKVRSAAKIMAKAVGQSEQEALDRLAVSPQCGFAVSFLDFLAHARAQRETQQIHAEK